MFSSSTALLVDHSRVMPLSVDLHEHLVEVPAPVPLARTDDLHAALLGFMGFLEEPEKKCIWL